MPMMSGSSFPSLSEAVDDHLAFRRRLIFSNLRHPANICCREDSVPKADKTRLWLAGRTGAGNQKAQPFVSAPLLRRQRRLPKRSSASSFINANHHHILGPEARPRARQIPGNGSRSYSFSPIFMEIRRCFNSRSAGDWWLPRIWDDYRRTACAPGTRPRLNTSLLLFIQRFTHALRNNGWIVVHGKRHGALKAVGSRRRAHWLPC